MGSAPAKTTDIPSLSATPVGVRMTAWGGVGLSLVLGTTIQEKTTWLFFLLTREYCSAHRRLLLSTSAQSTRQLLNVFWMRVELAAWALALSTASPTRPSDAPITFFIEVLLLSLDPNFKNAQIPTSKMFGRPAL